MLKRLLFLSLGLWLFLGALSAANPHSVLMGPADNQLDRANAKLEKLRQGYAMGAVSKRELEEAENEVRELERRLQRLQDETKEPGPAEVRLRLEEARYDYEKSVEKSKRYGDLYQAGVVSRNDAEAAQVAASQAEIYLKLNEELLRRVEEIAKLPKLPRIPHAPAGNGLGDGGFSVAAFYRLQDDYFREFHQALPISAFGPSETHEKMGFDHEGRVDVAVHPDSPEGKWLISALELRHIPFIAFRSAVPSKATGAHIHMGFPSPRN